MSYPSLEERLAAIEQRLERIEQALDLTSPVEAILERAHTAKETQPGNWLAGIAIVCFVLAAGFIIKLSIDSGWLTPVRQIGLAGVLGIALISAGLMLMRLDREYAGFLPGGGAIVLYLAGFAAHNYYALFSFEQALLLTAFISALCGWLYTEIRHDLYLLIAAIGAYSAPMVLGMGNVGMFSLWYFVLCSLAFSLLAIRVQSRRLIVASAYLAMVLTAVGGFILNKAFITATIAAVHCLIFAAATYYYTAHHKSKLTAKEAWRFFPVGLLACLIEYSALTSLYPWMDSLLLLGFAAGWMGLYRRVRSRTSAGILLQVAHLMAIAGLYGLVADSGSLAVSGAWIFYAALVILWAFQDRDQVLAKSAVLVLGFAAGKVLLYDVSSAPILIRIFCLLLTGAGLYGAGFFMRKIAAWKSSV